VNDLPDGTPTVFDDNAYVAIEPYPDGSSISLKKATVTISWLRRGAVQSYSASTLIGRDGL
jgi:hypothetical protein